MTTTIRKAWTAFVRPLTGGTARVVVRKVGGPAPIGGMPPVPDRDFRLVAGSAPVGEAFDRDVAEAYVRRFNEEGLINAFVRMNANLWVTKNGDMRLERIREDRDGLDLSEGLADRVSASMKALRDDRDDVPGHRVEGKPITRHERAMNDPLFGPAYQAGYNGRDYPIPLREGDGFRSAWKGAYWDGRKRREEEEAYWKGVDERLAVHIPTAEEVAEEAARYEADKG